MTALAANTQHTFRVRGTNAAGVVSSAAQYAWTVDTLSPTVPALVSNRGAFTNQRNVSLTFTSTDALSGIARYECLTGSTWAACTSPRELINLADGTHSLQVRAVDNAGNMSAAGTSSVQVDTAVPTVTFSQAPANNSTATSVSFTFAAADTASGISTIMCSLDNAAFAACTSPRAVASLAIGPHSFRVQAVDRAGNSVAATHNWTIIDMPTQTDYEQGVALYNVNCAGCHSAINVTNKLGRSAQLITAAIGSITQMRSLSSLTPVQVNLIALALRGPGGGVVTEGNKTLYACNASDVRTSTALRLSNREFISSLSALLNDFSANSSTPLSNDSALQTLFSNLPSDISTLNSTQEENPFVLSQRATTGFFEATYRAAILVSTASTGLANYPNTSNCLSAGTITQACHRNFVRELTTRAFRRIVPTTEADSISTSIFNASLSKADLLTDTFAVIASYPDFMYKAYNTGTDTPSVTRQTTVSGLELANKLSFFLTGAPADATLRAAAAAGDLNNTASFSTQVDRLMASAAGQAHLIRLFRESYGHDVISNLQYTSTFLNGQSTSGLRDAMISELDYFFVDEVLTKRSSFNTLMTSRNSRVPASSLAQIYGVTASTSATTLPVDRAGFLTRAAYLTKKASYYTSPVKRGRHMMEQVLCENIPDPPANAPTAVPEDQGTQLLSTRSRYENLTQQPNTTCVACHTRMNAYGFALEGFDALGRLRSAERIFNTNGTQEIGTVAVNTNASVVVHQNDLSINVRDASNLMTALGTSDKAIMCFAQHVRSFDVRQKTTSLDYCEMNEMLNVMYGTNGTQGSVYDAIKAYVTSNRFKVWKY